MISGCVIQGEGRFPLLREGTGTCRVGSAFLLQSWFAPDAKAGVCSVLTGISRVRPAFFRAGCLLFKKKWKGKLKKERGVSGRWWGK